MDIIGPAVEGTINILEASKRHQVKKVVITSSFAASWYGNFDKVLTDDDWSLEKDCSTYEKSKLRAELATWDFWKKSNKSFELVTVNPTFVIGPLLSNFGGESRNVIADILTGKLPGLPRVGYACVDVRDVALAHIRAMENPNSNGNRYLITSDSLWLKEIGLLLSQEFKTQGISLRLQK